MDLRSRFDSDFIALVNWEQKIAHFDHKFVCPYLPLPREKLKGVSSCLCHADFGKAAAAKALGQSLSWLSSAMGRPLDLYCEIGGLTMQRHADGHDASSRARKTRQKRYHPIILGDGRKQGMGG